MKIACDICEKVEEESKIKHKWLEITINCNTKYLLCEECKEKFWKFLSDAKQLKEQK